MNIKQQLNIDRKLLILDLDETLIYGTETPLAREADFLVEPYYIYRRPHLEQFLNTCLNWFDVAIWTSSTKDYAVEVVAAIFENPNSLAFLWAIERCTITYDYELLVHYSRKRLKKVKRKGYALESIIAVDDTPQKWSQSYGNLVQVKPFEGDETDYELLRLLIYLDKLRNVQNIRTVEKRSWRYM